MAYHPVMLVKLLVYAYCIGMPGSRRIERGTYEDVALSVQVLQLCQRAGLVRLGHVAIDGTKVQANALRHKAMSYARMGETEQRLEREVRARLEQAAARDAAEDAQYGKGRRGDELPEELARRESRLRKIREAKAELEAEARAAAVTQAANDVEQLVPLLEQVERNVGRLPAVVTADAGYFSETNVTAEALRAVDLYVPPNRERHSVDEVASGEPPPEAGVREQMQHKARTPERREVYRWRKAIAEPVFGQTKACRGFRRFAMRGLANVSAEWGLISLTHNVLKLFRAGWQPALA